MCKGEPGNRGDLHPVPQHQVDPQPLGAQAGRRQEGQPSLAAQTAEAMANNSHWLFQSGGGHPAL